MAMEVATIVMQLRNFQFDQKIVIIILLGLHKTCTLQRAMHVSQKCFFYIIYVYCMYLNILTLLDLANNVFGLR
jgi:hypothetical protein